MVEVGRIIRSKERDKRTAIIGTVPPRNTSQMPYDMWKAQFDDHLQLPITLEKVKWYRDCYNQPGKFHIYS